MAGDVVVSGDKKSGGKSWNFCTACIFLIVVYCAISILLRRRLDCVWFKVVIHIHLYASKRVVGRKWVAEVITVLYELKHCF